MLATVKFSPRNLSAAKRYFISNGTKQSSNFRENLHLQFNDKITSFQIAQNKELNLSIRSQTKHKYIVFSFPTPCRKYKLMPGRSWGISATKRNLHQ